MRLRWISRFVADIASRQRIALFVAELRYVAANNRWLNAFSVVGEALVGQHHGGRPTGTTPMLGDLHAARHGGGTVEAYPQC